ncbi:hypothetical protein LTR36_001059 [Oleoguttula mirabilis]|uniref:BHLH domain-containing protein n=1 Tax=Oleoguttula mirabilis TaxID=1507867 RepID=A0AAV9JPU8_9PEZI|nr:hypothetical protein LTR36_001059 [Oleoguttula mirabilis]
MPRPHAPPTPGSSSEMRGKEGSMAAPPFNLPPTAFPEPDRYSAHSSTPSASGSDSSYRPVSPPSPADLSSKRPATQARPVITKDDFALPPPPTRSRKIIQMKPKESERQESQHQSATEAPQVAGRTQSTSLQGGKRKQNGTGNTAAGRKTARKTAHSLIERRRRSKMNEEFDTLKSMIPACAGQEMHKLAILQASIEYLRYLEQCVTDLQAQNGPSRPPPPPAAAAQGAQDDDDDDDDEMEDDGEAEGTAPTPPAAGREHSASVVSLPSLSQITSLSSSTMSPSIFPTGTGRHYSISSASQASYSPYIHSAQTSPAFGPQLHHMHHTAPPPPYSTTTFGLGSPALKPMDAAQHTLRHIAAECATELSDKQQQQRPRSGNGTRSDHELDHEAAAALSMLNHDRRGWRAAGPLAEAPDAGRGNGGMSVRDLLSG